MQSGEDPAVLTAAQAAEMLLADPNQIRKWANAGVIPAHRVPGSRRYWFKRDELLAWIKDDGPHSARLTTTRPVSMARFVVAACSTAR
ncbi:MAG TPA: helix-turn-helix domain-containing protein [Actinomycetota bacterium]|nr:helix-turn-helix domain-containing protein [Actinomycetota bacterium]